MGGHVPAAPKTDITNPNASSSLRGQAGGGHDVADGESGGKQSVSPQGTSLKMCKVEGCKHVMEFERAYYRRYSICEEHLKSSRLMVDGKVQRFCQQCAKFQPIEDFDGKKKSCRIQLEKHSARRRNKLRRDKLARQQQERAGQALPSSPEGGASGSADNANKDGDGKMTASKIDTVAVRKSPTEVDAMKEDQPLHVLKLRKRSQAGGNRHQRVVRAKDITSSVTSSFGEETEMDIDDDNNGVDDKDDDDDDVNDVDNNDFGIIRRTHCHGPRLHCKGTRGRGGRVRSKVDEASHGSGGGGSTAADETSEAPQGHGGAGSSLSASGCQGRLCPKSGTPVLVLQSNDGGRVACVETGQAPSLPAAWVNGTGPPSSLTVSPPNPPVVAAAAPLPAPEAPGASVMQPPAHCTLPAAGTVRAPAVVQTPPVGRTQTADVYASDMAATAVACAPRQRTGIISQHGRPPPPAVPLASEDLSHHLKAQMPILEEELNGLLWQLIEESNGLGTTGSSVMLPPPPPLKLSLASPGNRSSCGQIWLLSTPSSTPLSGVIHEGGGGLLPMRGRSPTIPGSGDCTFAFQATPRAHPSVAWRTESSGVPAPQQAAPFRPTGNSIPIITSGQTVPVKNFPPIKQPPLWKGTSTPLPLCPNSSSIPPAAATTPAALAASAAGDVDMNWSVLADRSIPQQQQLQLMSKAETPSQPSAALAATDRDVLMTAVSSADQEVAIMAAPSITPNSSWIKQVGNASHQDSAAPTGAIISPTLATVADADAAQMVSEDSGPPPPTAAPSEMMIMQSHQLPPAAAQVRQAAVPRLQPPPPPPLPPPQVSTMSSMPSSHVTLSGQPSFCDSGPMQVSMSMSMPTGARHPWVGLQVESASAPLPYPRDTSDMSWNLGMARLVPPSSLSRSYVGANAVGPHQKAPCNGGGDSGGGSSIQGDAAMSATCGSQRSICNCCIRSQCYDSPQGSNSLQKPIVEHPLAQNQLLSGRNARQCRGGCDSVILVGGAAQGGLGRWSPPPHSRQQQQCSQPPHQPYYQSHHQQMQQLTQQHCHPQPPCDTWQQIAGNDVHRRLSMYACMLQYERPTTAPSSAQGTPRTSDAIVLPRPLPPPALPQPPLQQPAASTPLAALTSAGAVMGITAATDPSVTFSARPPSDAPTALLPCVGGSGGADGDGRMVQQAFAFAEGCSFHSGRLQRMALKILNCSLGDLQPDARAQFETWLSGMGVELHHMVARNGCIHLVADVVLGSATAAGISVFGINGGSGGSSRGIVDTEMQLMLLPAAVPPVDGVDMADVLSPADVVEVAATTTTTTTTTTSAGAAIVDLLRRLLGTRASKLGGKSAADWRSRLVLQLEDRVVSWTLLRRPSDGNTAWNEQPPPEPPPAAPSRARGVTDMKCSSSGGGGGGGGGGGAHATVEASTAREDLVCYLPRLLSPAPAPAPELLSIYPVAIEAGKPAHVQVALRLPSQRAAVAAKNAEITRGNSPLLGTKLFLRFGGDDLVSCDLVSDSAVRLKVSVRSPPPLSTPTTTTMRRKQGQGGAKMTVEEVAKLEVAVPRLQSFGMAVVEIVTGDVLGPWMPLLVVPSAEVASELNGLAEQQQQQLGGIGSAVLLRFLKDLGTFLSTDVAGSGGGYVAAAAAADGQPLKRFRNEVSRYGTDMQYSTATAAVSARPAAAAAALPAAVVSRLLRQCNEWGLLRTRIYIASRLKDNKKSDNDGVATSVR